MKYKIIIFDADDTLFDFKKSEREAFKITMEEFNLKYDENYHFKIYKEINTTLWKDFELGIIPQEKINDVRFKIFSEALNIKFDTDKFACSYINNLGNASFLYEESTELIKFLYKDYILFIVTNGLKEVQNNRIKKSNIAKYFKNIIVSDEVKVAKPNPKIFEYALKDVANTPIDEILIVGDSLSSDIQGGINLKADTCWYNPNKLENKTTITPTYEISNLMELKDILYK
ncbi:YjjG family noncanonical pyrimidine nucleotidase [Clostridium sp. C2-6-12]|uniref:YjjG family noncanonical pyrimidine nucleotidase n=1 Tax=Clostridium sp. C2-6-12 TaxID=2698832 RepID=UPI00136CA956|nr:YjjG family noncanonical pyrimidine nucleotidase [Clostridium sp. C2-6-12]